MERCNNCPIKEKIELYHQAAANTVLALDLASKQKIGPDDLVMHFGGTAAQLEKICQSKLLCQEYERKNQSI